MTKKTDAKATLLSDAAAYASQAHSDMHNDGAAYVVAPFASVQEYVEFEFNGDASSEASDLARKHGVSSTEARSALAAALADVDLGHLNEAWADIHVQTMAERDAETFVDAFWDDVDSWQMTGADDWACCDGQFESGMIDAGFTPTRERLGAYCDALIARVGEIVTERDEAAAPDLVAVAMEEFRDELADALNNAILRSPALRRLTAAGNFADYVAEKVRQIAADEASQILEDLKEAA